MSRRARASKEGAFLESVRTQLQTLSADLAEVKSAMQSLSEHVTGSNSQHMLTFQYDSFYYAWNLLGDWESYEAWNALGFEGDPQKHREPPEMNKLDHFDRSIFR